jgi:hypothetical protein
MIPISFAKFRHIIIVLTYQLMKSNPPKFQILGVCLDLLKYELHMPITHTRIDPLW